MRVRSNIWLVIFIGFFGFVNGVNANSPMSNQCFSDPNLAYQFLLSQQKQAKKPIININTATQAEFLTLDGVGVKTAEAIVFYRESVGRFNSVDELLKVKGIGQKTLDKNRHRLTVQ